MRLPKRETVPPGALASRHGGLRGVLEETPQALLQALQRTCAWLTKVCQGQTGAKVRPMSVKTLSINIFLKSLFRTAKYRILLLSLSPGDPEPLILAF
jgi:hypothetical protein